MLLEGFAPMSAWLKRYSTPFVTGLFIVSLISGVALFFHIGPAGFHGMHEWLSMVLILPFVLHLWKNWRPFSTYFRHLPMVLALILSALAGAVFLLPAEGPARAGGPPQFALARSVLQASVTEVAPILDSTPEALQDRLAAQGIALQSPKQPLAEAATAAGISDAQLAAALLGQ